MAQHVNNLLQVADFSGDFTADKSTEHRARNAYEQVASNQRIEARLSAADNSTDKSEFTRTVSATRRFPFSVSTLWDIAGHPAKVSWAVPMLRGFRAPAKLRVGSGVAETHTILGWPQIYVGRVTEFEPGLRWGMSNHPRGSGPFPLPHQVRYDFEGDEHASHLTLTCNFRCRGLLALPFGPWIVAWVMKRALTRMVALVAKQVEGGKADKVSAASPPDEKRACYTPAI